MKMESFKNTMIMLALTSIFHCCGSEVVSIEAPRATGFNQILHRDGIAERRLQEVDLFAELNLLLSEWAVILKPFDYFDLPAPLAPTTSLQITNTRCTNIGLGAIRHEIVRDDTEAINTFRVGNLEIECEFNWAFKNWLIVLETGNAQIQTSKGKLQLNIVTKSDDFNTALPKSTSLQEIDGCIFEITLESLDLQGFVRAFFANIFESMLRDSIETTIGPQACAIFNQKKMPIVQRMIENVTTIATPYLEEITQDDVDPLEPQRNLFIPSDARLLNFTSRDPNEFGVTVFETVKNNFNEEYGKYIPDENGNPFLAVNQVVRDFLLDGSNRLSSPFMEAIIEQNDYSFENCDFNICIKGTLKDVRIRGLDSIEEFSILEPIGRQTAANFVKWSDFRFEIVVETSFMSTDPDLPFELLIELPTTTFDLTAVTKFKNMESTFAFLSALDLNIILGIKMRQILNSQCALAFLPALDISQLEISFDDTENVQISNFISSGVETLTSSLIEAFFSMFEIGMQKALPNYVATTFREIVGKTVKTTLEGFSNRACQPITGNQQGFVNFNDLFYNTTEAALLGITPDSTPYGDSIAELKGWFDETMLTPNIRGFPTINELFIKPTTQIFSQTIGKLSLDIPAIECDNRTVTNAFSFEIVDIIFENLDSLGYPLKIFEPQKDDPYILKNNINVGAEKPLSLSSNIVFSVGSDGRPNALKLSLNFTDTNIFGNIFAKIREDSFLDFPLRDALNPFCYLSSIPLPTSLLSSAQTISFRDVEIGKSGAALSANCTDCGSVGMTELPKLLTVLKSGIDLVTTLILQTSEEFLNGGDSQGLLNNVLSVAGQACPHHPDYDENFDARILLSSLTCQGPLLPTLSQNSTELLMISTILISYMGSIIVPLSLGLESYPESDPLSAQSGLDSNGLISFDGSLFDSPLSQAITAILTRMDEIIGGSRIDVASILSTTANLTNSSFPIDQNQNNLGINAIFGGFDPLQIDVYRSWEIPSPSFSNLNDITNITVEVVRIFGLDDFNKIDLFNPLGSQTIQSSFEINNIVVEFIGSVHLPSTQPERIEAKVNITEIQFNSSILVALDEARFSTIKMGSLLDTNLSQSCVIPAFRAIDLTQVRTSIGAIENISYSGFLSDDASNILSESTKSFLDEYAPFLITIIPSFVDDYIREVINEQIRISTQNPAVTSFEDALNCSSYQVNDTFIDFNKMFLQDDQTESKNATNGYGNIPIMIRNFIDNYLEAPDTRFNFRTLESTPKLNGYLPERFVFQNDPVDLQIDLNQTKNAANDYVNIKISQMVLQNVDSVTYPLEILKPNRNDPYTLDNVIKVGTASRPILAQFVFEGSLTGSSTNFTERLNVTLQMSEAQLTLSTRSKIDANAFFNLPLLGLFNINCLLATIPPPNFFGQDLSKTLSVDLDLIYSNLKVSVQCIQCSTSQFESLESSFESLATENLLNVYGLAFIQYVKGPLKEALQLQIDAALLNAGPQCIGLSSNRSGLAISTQFPSNARRFGVGIILPFSFGVILLILISKYNKSKMKSNHQRWLLSLREDQLLLLYFKQVQAEKREKDDVDNASSMLFNAKIFTSTRYSIPLLIICCFALFVMGHASVAAYTNITGDVGGEQILVFQFFKLKITDTIVNGWSNGTRVLSIILVFTSILWPYAKLILTLGAWILPPSILPMKERGEVLNWLDLLTKWSVLGMFVLFLVIPFYNISITSEESLILPQDFYNINVILVLVWGFYSSLFGQILSHIISNVCSNAQEQISASNRFFSENDHSSIVAIEDDMMPMGSLNNGIITSHESSKSSRVGSKETNNFKFSSIGTSEIPVEVIDESKLLDLKVKEETNQIIQTELFSKTSEEVVRLIDQPKFIEENSEVKSGQIDQTKLSVEGLTGTTEQIEESNLESKLEEVSNTSNEDMVIDQKLAPSTGSQKVSISANLEKESREEITAQSKISTQQSNSIVIDQKLAPSTGSQKVSISAKLEKESQEEIIAQSKISIQQSNILSTDETESTSLAVSSEERNDYGRKCALCQYSFRKDVFSHGTSMKVTEIANIFISCLCLLIIILLFAGYGSNIFIVEIYGLARYLVANETSKVKYSAFQVVRIFQQTAADLNSGQLSSGLLLLASVFIITTVLIPVIKIISLGLMWFSPMSMQSRYTLLRLVKLLRSWQYLEVFIVSVLLLMWLGEAFVETYLDAYCDGLKTTVLPLAVLSGLIDEEDARCIYITVEPRTGLFLLIVASIMLEFVTQLVVKATEHHMEDFNDFLDLSQEHLLRDARQGSLFEDFENSYEQNTTEGPISNTSNGPSIDGFGNHSVQNTIPDVRSNVSKDQSIKKLDDDDTYDKTQNEGQDVGKGHSIDFSDDNLGGNKFKDAALEINQGKPIETSDDNLTENKSKEDKMKENESKEDGMKEDELKDNESRADELKGNETKEDGMKEDELKGNESKEDEMKGNQSKDDEMKEDESKENESKKDELKDDEMKENESKEDESKENNSKENEFENEVSIVNVDQPSEVLDKSKNVASHVSESHFTAVSKNDSANDDEESRVSEGSLSDVSEDNSVYLRLEEIALKIQRENPRFTDLFTYLLTPTNKAAYNKTFDNDEKSEESSFYSDSYAPSDDESSIHNQSIDLEKQKSVQGSMSASKAIQRSISVSKVIQGSISASKAIDGSISASKANKGSISASKTIKGSINASKVTQGSISAPKANESSIISTSSSDSSSMSSSIRSAQLENTKQKKQFFFF